MKPYYQDEAVTIYCGDCVEVMAAMPENSVDAIVTDPPYGLQFMGKEWDTFSKEYQEAMLNRESRRRPRSDGRAATGFQGSVYAGSYDLSLSGNQHYQFWTMEWATQALRVLKPGGYLLAFGGTRTYHRLVCGLEDAGFEIRDTICWLYGSGFPKNLDISKQIDKMSNRVSMFEPFALHYENQRKKKGLTHNQVCEIGKFYDKHNHGGASSNWAIATNVPTMAQWQILQPMLGLSDEFLPLIERVEAEREVVGDKVYGDGNTYPQTGKRKCFDKLHPEHYSKLTAPTTDAAKEWQGWGTALKPAFEPIVVARKPISEKNVALNVMKWGTGGLDIDGTRVRVTEGDDIYAKNPHTQGGFGHAGASIYGESGGAPAYNPTQGRWPANVILDEEAARMLAEQSGQLGNAWRPKRDWNKPVTPGIFGGTKLGATYPDMGGASRFFYVAKASSSERGKGNIHPTCKPVKLMEYLVKLVSREGATILDPFAGSMSTVLAAVALGRKCIAIEQSEEYCEMLRGRCRQMVMDLT